MKSKLFIALIALATLISCNSEKTDSQEIEQEEHGPEGIVTLNENQQKALNLKLGNFQMRNLTTVVKTNGQLTVPPASKADITAIIGGNVKEINVFHGDKVKKGQLLAILEHPDYIILQEEFADIANQLEFLNKEYLRQKELFENNVGSGRDLQKVKADYYAAKSKYAGLKSRLKLINISPEKVEAGSITSSIRINSPIDGYINDININLGTYIGATDKLFSITDNDAIHADFTIYEKDAHLVKDGQTIHFTVANIPEQELTATIFAIGKEFESSSRSIEIHASINNPKFDLIQGMYISGHLHTDKKYTRTLPNDAVVTEGTKSFIFIYDESFESDEHSHAEPMNQDADNHEGHNEDAEEDHHEEKAFRMVEVIKGQSTDGYTEIHLINPLPKNTLIVMNAAYYLLADMGKEETEHEH